MAAFERGFLETYITFSTNFTSIKKKKEVSSTLNPEFVKHKVRMSRLRKKHEVMETLETYIHGFK